MANVSLDQRLSELNVINALTEVARSVSENETELRHLVTTTDEGGSALREILEALDEWKAETQRFLSKPR